MAAKESLKRDHSSMAIIGFKTVIIFTKTQTGGAGGGGGNCIKHTRVVAAKPLPDVECHL